MRKIDQATLVSSSSTGAHAKISARSGDARSRHPKHDGSRRADQIQHDDRLGPDTSKWEIKDFLTFRINLLYRLLDRQLKKMLAEHHDLSIAEWRVLGQLATNSPTTVRDIAAKTYMAKSQISRAAASLVRNDYAVRSKDAADERSAVFAITKEGQKKYETVMRMNRERQRRLIAQLDLHERRVMFDAVGRLISYVRGNI
jgi:DNA-binding MarR family transcriptional regulator